LILLTSFVLAQTAPKEPLLVGSPGATYEEVCRVVGDRGTVRAKDSDGFFHVTLQRGGSPAKKVLAQRFKYVLVASAKSADKNSLPSLNKHIEFLRARREVLSNGAEYRETAGFYEALAFYLEPRVGLDGTIDQDALRRAVEHRDQMPVAQVGSGTRAPSATFSSLGPQNLGVPYRRYVGQGPLSGWIDGIALPKITTTKAAVSSLVMLTAPYHGTTARRR